MATYALFVTIACFIRSMLRLHAIPRGVVVQQQEINRVSAGGDDDKPWLAVPSTQSFKSVVTASHEKILLGWRKVGFGQNHFGAFSVIPLRGETTLDAARREMKAAAGIEPTDLIPMGKLLIVTEGSSEAREEEVILAPCWTGKAIQTKTTIPGVFRIKSYPRPPRKSASLEKLSLSSTVSTSSGSTRSSRRTPSVNSLPSFHPMSPEQSGWERFTGLISRLSSPPPQPDLALPWHCMQPEDRIWYPLLVGGKKFVGRVDYAAPKEGETFGEIRRWWFAELSSS
ncbi:hypothetical protein FRB93_005059 [Tulasnella sp. JGI-2019a]|nr:hypothetical protein FRB93_005059 [Tulasnella sp. JGI-2019a]